MSWLSILTMTLPDRAKNLSGLLLESPSGVIDRKDLQACRRLKFFNTIGRTNWEVYSYNSPEPLRGEERNDTGASTFTYSIVCRRSGSRLLILSTGRLVVPYLLEHELNKVFTPHLRRVQIAVDLCVKAITTSPRDYALSFTHARVPAYGANLRSVSFYGDDLANATLFKDHLQLMTFFTCGLRLAVGGTEIVRLSTDGALSFILTDTNRVIEVEQVLHFLRSERYLDPDPSSPES
jgi:hypothetical protein